MANVVFAFSPDGYYFMESPSQWAMSLPPELYKRFSTPSTLGAADRVGHVYCMALGANNSYYLSYRARDNSVRHVHSGLPPGLRAWVSVKDAKGYAARSLATMQVVLGPNNESYFAADEHGITRGGLPADLEQAIQKLPKNRKGVMTEWPKLVALGVNGTYVMATTGGGGSWYLGDEYPALKTRLDALKASMNGKGGMFNFVHHISLDAHSAGTYVMTSPNGSATATVKDEQTAAAQKIIDSIPGQTQRSGSRKTSNVVGALKLAKVGLDLFNALNGQPTSSGGGGYSSSTIDTSAWQSGMQNSMWSSVQGAAQDPIQ